MKREFIVWKTTDDKTQMISEFFISDVTEEEHKQGITRPKVAIFPVSILNDVDRQRDRANQLCHALNGRLDYVLNDAGREYDRKLIERKRTTPEQHKEDEAERQRANELFAEKLTNDLITTAKSSLAPKSTRWF